LLSHVKTKGIEEAQIGDWYGVYQIDNEETFQKVVEGELTGFSIEAYLDVEMAKLFKNNNDYKKLFKMDKEKRNLLKQIFDFMSSKIEEFETEETPVVAELESELVPEENWTINWGEVGAEVTKTYTNDADEEVTEPVEAGTYVTDSGIQVIVGEDGMLEEVIAAPAEEEPEEAAEVAEENLEAETPAAEETEETPETLAAEETPAEETPADDEAVSGDIKALLDKLLGQHDDGEFYLSVYKADGEYKWGSVSMYKDLKLAKEVEDKEKELNDKIVALEKEVGKAPAADPALGIEPEKNKGVDTENMSAYERIVAENNYENAPTFRQAR